MQTTSLRQHLHRFDLDAFVQDCSVRTGFAFEQLYDAVFDLIARMLQQEEKFEHSFPHVRSLEAYLRKAAVRDCIREVRKHSRFETEEDRVLTDPSLNPEEQVFEELAQHDFKTLMKSALEHSRQPERVKVDLNTLLKELLASPDVYVQVRRSGPEKGTLCFEVTALAQALQWDRKRVYKRIEQLRNSMNSQMSRMNMGSSLFLGGFILPWVVVD